MKVALIQLNSGDDIAGNIARVRELVGEAVKQGAQLVATPENTFLMESPGAPRTLYSQAEHAGVKAASELAKQHSIWLLIGSVAVKTDESGKTHNRSLLFSPDGNLAASYDKIH